MNLSSGLRMSINLILTLCAFRWPGPEVTFNGFGPYNPQDITPDDKDGYVFVPVDIQISRAEGTLHLMQK